MANADQFTRLSDIVARFSELDKYYPTDDAKLRIAKSRRESKKFLLFTSHKTPMLMIKLY